MKLILFDIDGTLIHSDGAGKAVLQIVLEALFGTAGPIDAYQMGGKTDRDIITDLLTAVGIAALEIEEKLPVIYQRMAQEALAIFPQRKINKCLGIDTLLTALAQREDVLLGLLTGNNDQIGPLKLTAAGIDPTQFRVCVYGSDTSDRNVLPQLALQQAKELTGRPFNGKNTIIIGDTPADILCARAGQATAVAVASGWHPWDALASCQPDYLFEDLSDTEHVLTLLLNDRGKDDTKKSKKD